MTTHVSGTQILGREILNPTLLDTSLKTLKIIALRVIEVVAPIILLFIPKLAAYISEWAVSNRDYLEGMLIKREFSITKHDNTVQNDQERIIPITENLTEQEKIDLIGKHLEMLWFDVARGFTVSIETSNATFMFEKNGNSFLKLVTKGSELREETVIENQDKLKKIIFKRLSEDEGISLEDILKVVANAHQGVFLDISKEYQGRYSNYHVSSEYEERGALTWFRNGNGNSMNVKIAISPDKKITVHIEVEGTITVRKDGVELPKKTVTETIELDFDKNTCFISGYLT